MLVLMEATQVALPLPFCRVRKTVYRRHQQLKVSHNRTVTLLLFFAVQCGFMKGVCGFIKAADASGNIVTIYKCTL